MCSSVFHTIDKPLKGHPERSAAESKDLKSSNHSTENEILRRFAPQDDSPVSDCADYVVPPDGGAKCSSVLLLQFAEITCHSERQRRISSGRRGDYSEILRSAQDDRDGVVRLVCLYKARKTAQQSAGNGLIQFFPFV